MASFTIPCPKSSSFLRSGSTQHIWDQTHKISFAHLGFQVPSSILLSKRTQFTAYKVQAKLNEVTTEKSSSSLAVDKKQDSSLAKEATDSAYAVPNASCISAFMTQVSDLVKLVNSKDITELQLKQMGCELLIRKKETLEQPPVIPAAPFMMPPTFQQMVQPTLEATPVPASAPAPKTSLPAPAKSSGSSHPPLKCPMAGTFYRSPAPGEPPFVKVRGHITLL
ncbi:hypothetical protein SAY87_003737 [Trapa incisa]|uniref:Uncharacterized protein n=1 Tax=Trapa incisa TaxID=236973 RepID=A0AAN7KJV6_9MYRT|nr:hypothetical protein SAY87_003737 [Trapa incisa]